MKALTCSICEKVFSNSQNLQKHNDKAICLRKGFICLRCLSVFTHMSRLTKHQKNIKKCVPCNSVLISKGPNQELIQKKTSDENFFSSEG